MLEPAEQQIALQLHQGLHDDSSAGLSRIVHGIGLLNKLPAPVVQLLATVNPTIVSQVADKRGFRLADMTPGQLLGQFMGGNMQRDTLDAIRLDFKVKRQFDILSHMRR